MTEGNNIFMTGEWDGEMVGGDFVFCSGGEEVLRISERGMFYRGETVEDAGELRIAMLGFFRREPLELREQHDAALARLGEAREQLDAEQAKARTLEAAIKALGETSGGAWVTDGDTACTLEFWARETIRRAGEAEPTGDECPDECAFGGPENCKGCMD